MKKKWLVMLSMILTIIALTACGDKDESGQDSEGDNAEQEAASPELSDPDLEGIPEIVAEINGEEITKEEFETTYEQQYQEIAMQSQLTGQEVDQDQLKEQTVENMVNQELLTQEANNRITEVSEDDIDTTMDLFIEQNQFESKDELIAAIEDEGMEEKEFMTMIETQVKVDQLISDESGDIEPTNEELEESYEMLEAQQEQMGVDEELPDFDDIKPELEEQVIQQKENEVAQNLVEQLREEAEVTINL